MRQDGWGVTCGGSAACVCMRAHSDMRAMQWCACGCWYCAHDALHACVPKQPRPMFRAPPMLHDPYARIPTNSATTLLRAQSGGSCICECAVTAVGQARARRRALCRNCRRSVVGRVAVPLGFQVPLAGPRFTWRASTPNAASKPAVRVDPPVVGMKPAAATTSSTLGVQVSCAA